jgi:glycosyltransferase involved in cell wall biosynthesis
VSVGVPSSTPKISILMTAHNSAQYLAEAIDSILQQQTLFTWELIFVDDGSIDDSLGIAQGYAHSFPSSVHVFTHPNGRNHGISASRNLALQQAKGELLAFLDSDDVWLPHHLETQAALLDSMPEVVMVYAGAERWVDFSAPFDEARSRAATWGSNYLPPLVRAGESAGLLTRGRLLQWFLKDQSLVPCICTVMLRTAVARSVGGFCDEFRGLYDDQAFHAKVALGHDVYANDCCVARYRQHAKSCCARARQEKTTERERFRSFLSMYMQTKAFSHE